MEINLGTILASIVNTGILYIVLKHFFFDKVKNILKEREEFINKSIRDAEEATERAKQLQIENENILKNVKLESRKITELEKEKAEKIYAKIVNEAKEEAKSIKERTNLEINRQREKAEVMLKRKSVDLAIEIATKLIEKNIDEGKNEDIIDNFILEVGK